MLLLLRSAHDHAYLHLCAGCGRGKHIPGNRRSVHGEGDDAFFCMMGILYGDAVDCTAVAAFDGIACPFRGDTGIDGKALQRGLHAENGLRDADERPGCRAGEPAVLALAEGGRVQNGPVARLAEVGVRSGNEPQRVVVKAAAHSQVALLGQGTDTGRAAAVSILLFLVTVPATALSVYFSALTAYGIHAYDFKLKKAAWGFILAVMMVPTPVVVFFLRQYLLGALPLEVVEAARIDGSGEFHTFNTIVLPIMKPALAVQAIFQFVANWNSLFLPSLIINSTGKKTLTMFVQMLMGESFRADYGVIFLALSITILPMFVMYFLLSRYIVEGVSLGSVKG